METTFKLKPITEEQVLSVVNYFDTGDTGELSESQIWFLYGRMRANGSKIDKAEEYLNKMKKRKAESYRWNKEQEINKHMKEYKQETGGDTGIYELMRLKEWEDGRTLVLGFMGNYDTEKNKQKYTHVIEIEERENPDYFQEIVKRFNLVID